jgi:hypothetical protein
VDRHRPRTETGAAGRACTWWRRKANVVVEVRYASRDDTAKVRTLVTETARKALSQVAIH